MSKAYKIKHTLKKNTYNLFSVGQKLLGMAHALECDWDTQLYSIRK